MPIPAVIGEKGGVYAAQVTNPSQGNTETNETEHSHSESEKQHPYLFSIIYLFLLSFIASLNFLPCPTLKTKTCWWLTF